MLLKVINLNNKCPEAQRGGRVIHDCPMFPSPHLWVKAEDKHGTE